MEQEKKEPNRKGIAQGIAGKLYTRARIEEREGFVNVIPLEPKECGGEDDWYEVRVGTLTAVQFITSKAPTRIVSEIFKGVRDVARMNALVGAFIREHRL